MLQDLFFFYKLQTKNYLFNIDWILKWISHTCERLQNEYKSNLYTYERCLGQRREKLAPRKSKTRLLSVLLFHLCIQRNTLKNKDGEIPGRFKVVMDIFQSKVKTDAIWRENIDEILQKNWTILSVVSCDG